MNRPRVLLADDYRVVLPRLMQLLESEFEVVGTAEDGFELIEKTLSLRPDVLVVDVAMPFCNCLEALAELRRIDKKVKVVFLTMETDPTYAAKAFQAGASACVLKHSASSELVNAVHQAFNGGTFLSPGIAGDPVQFHPSGKPPRVFP